MRQSRTSSLRLAIQQWVPALFLALTGLGALAAPPPTWPVTPADLFQTTNLWTVHLRFTPEQWAAIEPKGEPRRMAGRGLFDPSAALAPAFLQQGDRNQDGKLSREEFVTLGEKWFGQWDTERSGKLNADQLRAGLAASLLPPGAGGRGPGMNLQGKEGQRNGLAAAMGIAFDYVHADLEWEGRPLKNVAVRYKGNGTYMQSRDSLKRSLKIDLNKYVKGQKLAGVTKLNLHNNVSDASWMNEVLSHRLFRDAGVPAPRTAYARVYVTVSGQYERKYFGLYSVVEDIDKQFTAERFGTDQGAVFKPVTPALFTDLGPAWPKYQQTYDPKTELSREQTQRIIELCRLVSQATDTEFAARIADFLDLEEFARFMAVTVWLANLDSLLGPGQNFYVYLEARTQRFQFLPWDLDHSFGQFPMIGTQEQRENLSLLHPWQGDRRFLERVYKLEAFQKLYRARLEAFSQTIFQPERFHRQVDELARAIRPAVREESADKLARFDKAVAGESVAPAAGGGLGAFRRGGAGGSEPRKPIKPFVTARAMAVRDQLADKSEGQQLEGFGRGGRGGPGGARVPGQFLGVAVLSAFDRNQDGQLTRAEFTQGFGEWFKAWATDPSGLLTEAQLRAGLARDLVPAGGAFGVPQRPP